MNILDKIPDATRERIAKINKELKPFDWREGKPRPQLVAYLLDDGRSDNDWRCQLIDADGTMLADYLVPEELHWHVVSMMLNGFQARRKADFQAGMQAAVNTLHEHNQRVLGLIR